MATDKQVQYCWELAMYVPAEAKRLGLNWDEYSDDEAGILDREKLRSLSGAKASNLIGGIQEYMSKNWTWRPVSKKSIVAELSYRWAKSVGVNYLGRTDAHKILRYAKNHGLVLQGDYRQLVFTRNENGSRVPVDLGQAEEQFLRECSTVKPFVNTRLEREKNNQEEHDQQDDLGDIEEIDFLQEDLNEIEDIDLSENDIEEIGIDEGLPREAIDLLQRIKNAHYFAVDRNIDGTGMDAIGMRSFEDAARLFVLGVPANLIFSNIIQHWSEPEKQTIWNAEGMAFSNGIYVPQHQKENTPWNIDPQTFVPKVDVPGLAFIDPKHHHKALKLLLTMMHARIPTLCWGGSGTGKTTAYRHAAECLRQACGYKIDDVDKFPFGFLSMTRGTAPSAFNGRPMITNTAIMIEFMMAQAEQDMNRMREIAKKAHDEGDVVMSIWQKLYAGGGVMLLDEIDAGDENLILLVNAAIANGHFANTATGEVVEKHPDFIIGFAGNTNGMGANKLHGARNRLDHATLDRVRLGRIPFMLDMELAETTYTEIIEAGR